MIIIYNCNEYIILHLIITLIRCAEHWSNNKIFMLINKFIFIVFKQLTFLESALWTFMAEMLT